jgi:ABC-type spermidine/putrescine transport system permease subunit II
MSRRSYVPYVITGVAVLVVGLALGRGRGDEASLINSTSQVLLTVGFIVVVVAAVLELVGRAKNRG